MGSGKKNILIITRAHNQHAGGMERLSFELAQALEKEAVFDVRVIAHTGSRLTSPFFNLLAIPGAWAAAKQADIIHLGDPMLSFIGVVFKTLWQKKVSVMVHGLDITYTNPLYQLYLTLFFRNFDTYLPISRYVATLLAKHKVGGRTTIVNPGIHDDWYDPSITKHNASALVKKDVHEHVVLHTNGRLTARKGQAWFVANVLPKLPTNVLYVISGTGADEANIKKAAHAAGVTDRVILLRRISATDLKVLYNSADAFIQPNIPILNDVEGFGLVLLEAATCARPVFAANTEGMQDAITDGKNGRLLPAGDAAHWAAALNDWIKNDQYANKASAVLARTYTLEKFSWDTVIQKYIAAWSQIAK